eukprot:TRINITY_DN17069_c0_g1_i9.p1 TRINITY_DN17069_c0_g1~~TRINITY_DN17069_c0_g1_i9.p1  ORF type:complete len:363 (-),score=1.18 TRINITY_DN17069_c0_g1_i9:587-1675(-)
MLPQHTHTKINNHPNNKQILKQQENTQTNNTFLLFLITREDCTRKPLLVLIALLIDQLLQPHQQEPLPRVQLLALSQQTELPPLPKQQQQQHLKMGPIQYKIPSRSLLNLKMEMDQIQVPLKYLQPLPTNQNLMEPFQQDFPRYRTPVHFMVSKIDFNQYYPQQVRLFQDFDPRISRRLHYSLHDPHQLKFIRFLVQVQNSNLKTDLPIQEWGNFESCINHNITNQNLNRFPKKLQKLVQFLVQGFKARFGVQKFGLRQNLWKQFRRNTVVLKQSFRTLIRDRNRFRIQNFRTIRIQVRALLRKFRLNFRPFQIQVLAVIRNFDEKQQFQKKFQILVLEQTIRIRIRIFLFLVLEFTQIFRS